MRWKPPVRIPPSEITQAGLFMRRRALMSGGAAGLIAAALPTTGRAQSAPLPARASSLSTMERPSAVNLVTSYCNFYEFGTDKDDPPREAPKLLRLRPWSVRVDGEVKTPRTFDIEELLKLAPLEERVYRLRCVEAWSAVVPWIGYPLAELIRRVEPTSKAKFVEFTTLADPKQMPGLGYPVINWPYKEGLRLDEAMHPLALLTVGMYGQVLPAQNGAPVRIVVPWKYGFKSAKSIVRIRFTESQPTTAWQTSSPGEYGFYSNVNPERDHPRWSQKTERRLGEDIFSRRKPTLMFNGYAEQVASLYTGMDLMKLY